MITAGALAGVAAAATAFALGSGDPRPGPPTAPPKIYAEEPATSTTTRPAAATAHDAEELARRWATAWDRVTVCRDAAAQLRRVVALSAGALAQQLTDQPPRPGADASCHPERVIAARAIDHAPGRWTVIVQRQGETGGPLTLTLQPTGHGLRAVALDY